MPWSGKLVGGLIGGMLGGPVGAGLGASVGHVLRDGNRPLELLRLDWQHHAFRASGPGMVLTPAWVARGLAGEEVRVRVRVHELVHRAPLTPETDDENVFAPDVFVPYADLDGEFVDAFVRVAAPPGRSDEGRFRVPLPNDVRGLGGSGPARTVMALVACARAGGRTLVAADARFIRTTFQEGFKLNEAGVAWLRTWTRELRNTAIDRLSAQKVASRLHDHLDPEGRARLITWMWRGVAEAWPGEAQRDYVTAFAEELGSHGSGTAEGDDPRLHAWATLGVPPGTTGEALREAWLRLVQAWHPDLATTEDDALTRNRRLAEVNAAYRCLT